MEETGLDDPRSIQEPVAEIEAAAECLASATRVVALTGAGISAESGIATFRDQDGLWAQHDPDEVATLHGFRRDPARVWRFYKARRSGSLLARPNPAHAALAEIEARGTHITVVTQNIDGLHTRAGSNRVIEVHGSLQRALCADCDAPAAIGTWEDDPAAPPLCSLCGGMLRPDVVWFGEPLPMIAIGRAFDALRRCDLCFSIGTSAQVEPAASFAFVALEAGATLIEVNPERTPLSRHCQFQIRGPAGSALPAILSAAWPEHAQNS